MMKKKKKKSYSGITEMKDNESRKKRQGEL